MDRTDRLRRLKFRAWHRGTREADYVIGGFFDRHHAAWSESELALAEALIEEDDAEILGWAFGTTPVPERYAGPLGDAIRRLDYVNIPR